MVQISTTPSTSGPDRWPTWNRCQACPAKLRLPTPSARNGSPPHWTAAAITIPGDWRRHFRPTACLLAASSRSEEHKSELQSLMRISYAVFCLKKKKACRLLLETNQIITEKTKK